MEIEKERRERGGERMVGQKTNLLLSIFEKALDGMFELGLGCP